MIVRSGMIRVLRRNSHPPSAAVTFPSHDYHTTDHYVRINRFTSVMVRVSPRQQAPQDQPGRQPLGETGAPLAEHAWQPPTE